LAAPAAAAAERPAIQRRQRRGWLQVTVNKWFASTAKNVTALRIIAVDFRVCAATSF
jgi:hypothetical protein